MKLTKKTREEIKALICQTLDEREQQAAANKSVYRRICEDFEQELQQFDYIEPTTYVDNNSVQKFYNKHISYVRRIQDAISSLLRIAYQVNATAKLPAEQEDKIQRFMSSVLGLMAELKN